jgi:hypothetical protein
MVKSKVPGDKYGLEWAEQYHYITDDVPDKSQQYIKEHAVPL